MPGVTELVTAAARCYAGIMRYPDGGGLTAAGRARREQVRLAAAGLGAWLCFEDESGQGLRPPKGRTWGRRGHTPVVKVTARNSPRLSLTALIAVKPGCRPRLIYRVHAGHRRRNGRRKGFTETDYA